MSTEDRLRSPAERELDGLPVCPWRVAHYPGAVKFRELMEDGDRWRAHLLAERAHVAECVLCQQRDEVFQREVKEAGGRFMFGIPGAALGWIALQPGWARPMWRGAGFLVALTILRSVWIILFRPSIDTAMMFGEALLLAAGIGGGIGLVGGNVYRLLHPWAQQAGAIAAIPAGILMMTAIAIAAGGAMYVIPATTAELHHRWSWIVLGLLAIVLGAISGWGWFRPGRKFQF